MKKTVLFLALVVCPFRAEAQDVAAGEASFRKCMACHAVGEGAKNKVGPNSTGWTAVSPAPSRVMPDPNKNSGITWSKETFLDYIKDPKAKIPGTKMVFAGIKNEKEAGDLWAFLAQYSADGKTK